MSKLAVLFHRWRKDKSGASAVIFALTLPVMVGFMGLGTEVGMWYMMQRELQTATDVAAYTAALELRANESSAYIRSEASAEATRNGFDSSNGTLTISFLSSTRVRAEIVHQQPRLFSALFEDGSQTIKTVAEAEFQSGGPACVLALSGVEIDALTFTGNTSVNVTDCNIMSNSTASVSINQTGSSDVSADCVFAAGGIDYNSNLVTTECDSPVENAAPSIDPYSDLEVPSSLPGCTAIPSFSPGNLYNLTAGHYCGAMSLKGDVYLAPGTYYIDGDLDINSTANVYGAGVTIVLTGSNEMLFNGSATINLSAPTTDIDGFEGVLFYQDRHSTGAYHTINGNSSSSFEGAMYFPTNDVRMLGSGAVAGGCLQLIADEIYFSGDMNFEHNCSGSGTRQIDIVGTVDLVL